MRTNMLLAAAVGAVLTSTAAVAANSFDIYVSGSSAAKSFFQLDVQNFFGGATNAATKIYNYKDPAIPSTNGQPDYSVTVVTVGNNQGITGLAVGDTVSLHYAGELGSVWGVAGAFRTAARTRAQLTGLNCAASGTTVTTTNVTTITCQGSAFNHVTDTDGASPAVMASATADILVSDVEPDLFTADNWPTANTDLTLIPTVLGAAPTATNITAAKVVLAPTIGQVFNVVGNNIPGIANNQRINLSSNTVRAILTGQYGTWNQVPEANDGTNATPIFVCRRDHGSGTEISASVTFTGNECGLAGANPVISQLVTGSAPSTSDNFQENASTVDMDTCIATHNGSIGIRGLTTPSTGRVVFNIDGVEANAHNAAAGAYPYAYEAWVGTTGAHTGVPGLVATKLLNRLQSTTTLALYSNFQETVSKATPASPSNLAGGTFVVGTNTPRNIYGLQGLGANGGGLNTETGASIGTSKVPTALFDRGGNSCLLKTNNNQ